jgi:lipid-A-disaccharide synthase
MLSILPFEQEFYAQYDFEINYVGNPIVDAIYHYPYNQEFIKAHSYSDKPIVALLPGSRKQEILQCLPVMLEASKALADFRFIIAGLDYTKEWIAQTNYLNLEVVYDKTYDLLKCSKVAVVTSGTATLETALLNVPQVCCYKTSALTYFAAKKLIRVPYISLVNLINGKESIRELIQDNFTPSILRAEIIALADNEKYRSQILANYEILKTKIGGPGASDRAAAAILNFI